MTNPTDAELVREALFFRDQLVSDPALISRVSLHNCLAELASRIEALSASRREYGEKAWISGHDARAELMTLPYGRGSYKALVAERMHADLDALEREGTGIDAARTAAALEEK